ncbi:MAG: hypothetical protein KAS98_02390 [Deltaproteobacteria bacterium]|nr:hypothetical protein [Deltaproteobacteria bacterium]MCK5185646.1 hypothetical protein [Deltaproteobacteria bacterium]
MWNTSQVYKSTYLSPAQLLCSRSIPDEKAKQLMNDYLACEEDIIKLKKSYLSKFDAVMPGEKVMTCYQLENKIGAVVRFDKAGEIQLALQ